MTVSRESRTSAKPARRTLQFASLDDVVRDAEHLLAAGYERAGNWDLAQCCTHVAEWMRFPVEGFPKPPLPIQALLWMARNTVGPKKLRQYLDGGAMGTGKPTMPQTVIPSGGDAVVAVAKLGESVARFQAFTGTIHPSPFFGPMSKDDVMKLQLLHAAHHLSFLVPKG